MMPDSIRILILEDNPVDAELAQFELQEAGIKFISKVAMTEEDYVHELQEFSPDLILSDYDLPKYNGALALAEAKRRCPDIPFILVSGIVTEDRAIEILTQGAKDYVLKTRLRQRLVIAVRRALAEAEDRRALKQAEAKFHDAYRFLKKKHDIRTKELKAEMAARKKMEERLRENEERENARNLRLRQRAEERMKLDAVSSETSGLGADSQKLLHELQVFQIELEMQNEEIRDSKTAVDQLLEDYLDIYDFAPIGYFTLNRDGIILRVNLTGARICGVGRARMTGQRFQLHLSDEFYPSFNTFFRRTFEGKTIESCELMLSVEHKPTRFVQLRARLSENKEDCNLVMIDITDRKRAEALLEEGTRQLKHANEQLEDANKELESFSYSVSHDLKAPLRTIEGYSGMLMKKYGSTLDENAVRMVNVICNNTQKMGILIDDLLSFSRVLKSGIAISEIDMDRLVCDVWNEIRGANQERDLEVKITKLLPGFGDRILIRQVLFNLISNAVKFTKNRKPGIIEMSSYYENGSIVYYVKDNGSGFDMAYYDKLFGVFQRLHSVEEYEGTGVGLAIVQRIVKRHGGKVWAEGEVDEGAVFYFMLPLKEDKFIS
ncbi:MAG: ATP-binding protein [Syntrophales bacterium]|nr:ATP-binding protein [Syntrophales bacterium]